ncbi:MAG: carboxylate--amine ligase [Clostridiales bacterium]|jgi:hypothetical protein|nr:carboxylate--amine ligase [Clostridiales bacterium]
MKKTTVLRQRLTKNKHFNLLYCRYSYAVSKIRYKKYTHEESAQKVFYRSNGKTLNLQSPQTFNEKLWYLKIHYKNPLMTKCSDKYLAREYVKECGLSHILNDIYGVFEDARIVDFDKLPDEVFFKCNHNSGANMIYRKSEGFDKRFFRKKFNCLLRQNYFYSTREWNYKNIKPLIIAEKLLNLDGLLDYRFLCFNGKVALLMLDSDTCSPDGTHNIGGARNLYDPDFNRIQAKLVRENYDDSQIKKPENFETMKEYAEILSSPFPCCRVDFYNIDGKIVFGEMTFFHGGCVQEFEPDEYNYKYGSMIDLSKIDFESFKGN